MKRTKKIKFILTAVVILTFCQSPISFNAAEKPYTISGKTLIPTVKKDKDILLGEKGKTYTVKIPQNTYYISESLKVWSNTKLDTTNCVIRAKKTGFNMIATGSSEDNQKFTGYKRYRNITIVGGTWINSKKNTSSGIRLCRGSNITIKI